MRTIKFLFPVLLFSISGNSVNTNTTNCAVSISQQYIIRSQITSTDISDFLTSRGYRVITTPESADEGYTWTCKTYKEGIFYITTVYTDGENIIGFDDEMIG